MSAHRQHFFEANRAPTIPRPQRPDPGALIILALMVLFVVLLAAWTLAGIRGDRDQRLQGIRTPAVQVQELPPLSAYEASIVSYRAGFAAGVEQGCGTPTLSHPIEPR